MKCHRKAITTSSLSAMAKNLKEDTPQGICQGICDEESDEETVAMHFTGTGGDQEAEVIQQRARRVTPSSDEANDARANNNDVAKSSENNESASEDAPLNAMDEDGNNGGQKAEAIQQHSGRHKVVNLERTNNRDVHMMDNENNEYGSPRFPRMKLETTSFTKPKSSVNDAGANNDEAPSQDPPQPLEAADEESDVVEAIAMWLQGKLPTVLAKTRNDHAKRMFDYGFESVESIEDELLKHRRAHTILET